MEFKLTNSLVGRGHEGGSGSNKEGEEEEGTHLDSFVREVSETDCDHGGEDFSKATS